LPVTPGDTLVLISMNIESLSTLASPNDVMATLHAASSIYGMRLPTALGIYAANVQIEYRRVTQHD
jgi:hypothetical protein